MYECVWLAIVLRMLICTTHCMQLANNDDNDDDKEDWGGIHKKTRFIDCIFVFVSESICKAPLFIFADILCHSTFYFLGSN